MASTTVTLRDVARHAGVHPATASRALNNATRSLVNEATAQRVLQVAEELGYRPNPIARGLKTNRSTTVGVLLPDLTNPLFPPIVRGIEDRLAEDGYTAVLANTDNDPTKERLHFEIMRSRQVEGFILATAERDDPLIDDLMSSDAPMVMVNRTVENERAHAVVADDRLGSRLAVDHLVALGHTQIAHIMGPERLSTARNRLEGFLAGMRQHVVDADDDLIEIAGAFTEVEGARAFRRLLDRKAKFTAVYAANDLLALGCFDIMEEKGIGCPDEVSVVGYNDIPFMDKLRPALTTIRVHQYEIGVHAANLLLARLENPHAPPQTLMLKPELIVRDSTAPATVPQPGSSPGTS